jgi:hypothetical protein
MILRLTNTSESIRNNHDIELKMEEFGFSRQDVECGLQRAIDEFMLKHIEWAIDQIFLNNNGLTILKRTSII